jgi:hypothetical protein
MTVLRTYSEYLRQDSLADIDDLYSITKNTENYRSKKAEDLKNEHALIMRRIDRVTQQKAAYIRSTGVLPSSEDMVNVMPYVKNDDFDSGDPELASDPDSNKRVLIRRPTDPILNFARDNLRVNITEIDIKLRDYNYQLLKLSWMEKKISYLITNLMKNETSVQQSVTSTTTA